MVDVGENSLNGYERNVLHRNNGDGTFSDVAHVNRADRIEDGRGVAILDYDRDGRLDVLIRNYRQPAELLRGTGPRRHWLQVKLTGTASNRDAVGARIVAVTGDRRQLRVVGAGSSYLSSGSLVQHFGLGDATAVDRLEITWPSGRVDVVRDVAADRRVAVTEGRGIVTANGKEVRDANAPHHAARR